ncbi:hypothetical protein [Sphingobium lactosutens]|uniref:Uncharacterized protein n=1 Tax=Sphingobium lactosutens DS20 TaxID=1331060 RepID=T0HKS4_9SPHN|nr:hypothetical protein [Sphingobium lactosutens]EQB16941.1 hypothetical protein RLDS_05765 [Sphingobium lactosutens DS20]
MDFSKLATILYPKCPRCGGRSKSIEPENIDHANRSFGHAARGHHYLQLFGYGVTAGRQVYKRIPGKFGGLKQCTDCGHEFR